MSCDFSHFNATDQDPPGTFFEVLYFLQSISRVSTVHSSNIGTFAEDVHTGNAVAGGVYCPKNLTEASSRAAKMVDSWGALRLLYAMEFLIPLRWRPTFAVDPCRRKQPEL
jgi:hypothetical protein